MWASEQAGTCESHSHEALPALESALPAPSRGPAPGVRAGVARGGLDLEGASSAGPAALGPPALPRGSDSISARPSGSQS